MADLHTLLTRRRLARRAGHAAGARARRCSPLAVLFLAVGFILVPLFLTTKRAARRGIRPFYVYFAGIGLGFLLVEFSQLQRLSIFLGHPIYALGGRAVLGMLFSGIGSMAERAA